MSNNLAGGYKRSVGMGMHIGIGNLGGVSIHSQSPSTIHQEISNEVT